MRRRMTRQTGPMATPARRTVGAARVGFTVLEVMLAMGIFVVGFAAVVSLLPAAITLQRQAVEDVTADQVARQAEATLRARPMTVTELNGIQSNYIQPVPGGGAAYLLNRWSVNDRSYPSNLAEPSERTYFWVPMVRRLRGDVGQPASPEDFMVYVLILRPQEGVYNELSSGGNARYFYKHDPAQTIITGVPSINPYANRGFPEEPASPFRNGNKLINVNATNPLAPEAPWVPKVCMIQVRADKDTDGTKLTFHENGQPYNLVEMDGTGMLFSGGLPARPVKDGYRNYENLKIRPTDLIIDQWGKTHTVVTANEEQITLNDAIRCPQSWFDPTTGLLAADHSVWIWYAVPPARPKSPGANYANYVLSPGRSALVKVVTVQGAVIR